MSAELIPEPMTTGRSCMRVAGKSSEPNLSMPSGKRSTKNGPRGHQRNFPSGSARGQARRLEIPRPQKAMKKRRRKKKRKKSKHYSHLPKLPLICLTTIKFCMSFVPLDEDHLLSGPGSVLNLEFGKEVHQKILLNIPDRFLL